MNNRMGEFVRCCESGPTFERASVRILVGSLALRSSSVKMVFGIVLRLERVIWLTRVLPILCFLFWILFVMTCRKISMIVLRPLELDCFNLQYLWKAKAPNSSARRLGKSISREESCMQERWVYITAFRRGKLFAVDYSSDCHSFGELWAGFGSWYWCTIDKYAIEGDQRHERNEAESVHDSGSL